MTCFPRKVGDTWHVAFEVLGKQYTASLRTKSRKEADVRIGPIRDAIFRIENGTLVVPPGVKPREFVLAGGRVRESDNPTRTIGDLVPAYISARVDLEPGSLVTVGVHLGHFGRILGESTILASLSPLDMERYAAARLKEGRKGRGAAGYTIRKELRTFFAAHSWAAERRMSPAPMWSVKGVPLPKDKGREPFRTFDQIQALIEQGGMDESKAWETLYLTGEDLRATLDHVERAESMPRWIYPMVAFVALTGCRRSEMMRSRWEDWDLRRNLVRVREKKRNTSRDVTFREIDIHPRLGEAWEAWSKARPRSPFAVTADGPQLKPDQASDALRAVLSGHPRWSKIRGFHTFRHSVASILASEGIDQRYIDRTLGHQTEATRLRYQHLFPSGVSRAISSLLPS